MRLGIKKQTNKQRQGYTLTWGSFYVILNNLYTVAKMNFIRLANIQLYYAQSIWHNCTHVQTYLKSYILAEQSSPTVNIHLSS